MSKHIEVRVSPFSSSRSQFVWGEIVDGQFVEKGLVYKQPVMMKTFTKTSSGKFGAASFHEFYEAELPETARYAYAIKQLSDCTKAGPRHYEYDIVFQPSK